MKELDLFIALTNALPDPVLLLDDYGQILAANSASTVNVRNYWASVNLEGTLSKAAGLC